MGDEACILFPLVFIGKKNNSTIPNTHSLFFLAAELKWKSTFVFYYEKEAQENIRGGLEIMKEDYILTTCLHRNFISCRNFLSV